MRIEDHPKFAIVGAGAIGSLVGGILSHQGHDVTLVGRQRHVEEIRQHGLQIDGVAGDFTVEVNAAQALRSQPDLILLAVKSQDVPSDCEAIKPYAAESAVVMMQNGVRSAQAAATAFGEDHILGCTILFNARYLSPGRVTYANKGSIIIGRALSANYNVLTRLQEMLNTVAPTTISDNILGVQWTKLLVNALDSMTGLDVGACMRHPQMPRIGVWIFKVVELIHRIESSHTFYSPAGLMKQFNGLKHP